MITIGKGKVTYEPEQARAVVAGYAFGDAHELGWRRHGNFSLEPAPQGTRRRFAYLSYDCVLTSEGPIDMVDILVTAGLNGRASAGTMLEIYAVAEDISDELAHLPAELTFWDLDEDKVSLLNPPTDDGSPAWHMWRAWWLLEGVHSVGVAVTHKTLHHKRPRLFPLLDGQTVRYYARGDAWAGIHRELKTQADEFEELEDWFADLASKHGGVPLSRLRLHDILLWCDTTDMRKTAEYLGRHLV